jgi:hypothetical protein
MGESLPRTTIGWIAAPPARPAGIVATVRPGGGADGSSVGAVLAAASGPAVSADCCVFNHDGSLHAAAATTSKITGHRHPRSDNRRRRSLPNGRKNRRAAKKLRCDVEIPRGLGGLDGRLTGRINYRRGGSQRALD